MDELKVIDNFVKYMFNKWNIYEAERVFGELLGEHIYCKYVREYERNAFLLYANIDNDCKRKLIERANLFYNK